MNIKKTTRESHKNHKPLLYWNLTSKVQKKSAAQVCGQLAIFLQGNKTKEQQLALY